MGTAARVDQIDAGEIPARDAHVDPEQGAISGGQLVTNAFDGDGTVAEALLSFDLHAERASERVARWAGTHDGQARKTTIERRLLGFAMDAAVIFLLDPRLSSAIEQLERELWLAL